MNGEPTRRPKVVSTAPRPLDAAAQALVEAHLDLARILAREQYRRCLGSMPFDELWGEAQYAMVYAATRYEPAKGVQFGAFATLAIRRRLINAVVAWRHAGPLDLISLTDLSRKKDQAAPVDLCCKQSAEASHIAEVHEILDLVRRSLHPPAFRMLELYYCWGHGLSEIGEELGISAERVRQLLLRAVNRARNAMQRLETGSDPVAPGLAQDSIPRQPWSRERCTGS